MVTAIYNIIYSNAATNVLLLGMFEGCGQTNILLMCPLYTVDFIS